MRAAAFVLLAAGFALAQEPDTASVIESAAGVTPSPRQLAWQQVEFAAFAHFGMNTFTNREWGQGHEDPALFNPTEFDARQWVDACKQAGIGELIVTAKHHDGFCLWPSAYTEHSVKNSPWRDGKGDVVREVADACREAGIRFGVYLSPWDITEATYGNSPAYNEHFKNQLRELLTNYGEIAEVWFDGACGEGPNGKRQEYDWDGYYALIRELQPNAVISIVGPDVRWCGNEAGKCRASEWSVVPEGYNAMAEDLGSRDVLVEAVKTGKKLLWLPSQVDTSIRPGWFYHKNEDGKVKSLEHLLDIYYGSCGGNSQLLLNIPPDKRGLFHENDVARLKELGTVLQATFTNNFLKRTTAITASEVSRDGIKFGPENTLDEHDNTYWTTDDGVTTATIEYEMDQPRTFNRALLQEYIAVGQRIEEFALDAMVGSDWKEIARATTVGNKRLLRFDDVTAQRVRLRILQSRANPALSNVGLFYEPPFVSAPKISRDTAGTVTIEARPGVEIRYWICDTDAPPSTSRRYEAAFPLPRGGVVKAMAIPPDGNRYVRAGSLQSEAEFGAIKTNWKIVGAADPTAVNAIDGEPATNWVPDAQTNELVIDLGEALNVAAFEYVPRQDKAEAVVSVCDFYLGDDVDNWGQPAAHGDFGNVVNNPILQVVRLEKPAQGRYLRFVGLGSQGSAGTSTAEIGVILAPAHAVAEDKNPGWETLQPDPAVQTVARVTDACPLSDQENKGGWKLYPPMTDEFENGPLDTSKWLDHNPDWLGRQPALFYPGNVEVRDGKLHLTMKKEEAPDMPHDKGYHTYTSAAVQSKDTVRYGYFEVKVRPMNSAGSSSFWFYKNIDGWWTEIDVFELGARSKGYERKMNITVHCQKTPVTFEHQQIGGVWEAPFDLADDYHVYGFEWDEAELKFYFDGMLVRKGKNTDWHQPLTLNFDSETMPEWFGIPEDQHLPSTFSIEYVRCWKKG